jgi:hypothetical protein
MNSISSDLKIWRVFHVSNSWNDRSHLQRVFNGSNTLVIDKEYAWPAGLINDYGKFFLALATSSLAG